MRARAREVYQALYEAHQETGRPPTIRFLASRLLGFTPEGGLVSVTYYALQDLVEMGLVEKRMPIRSGMYIPRLPPDEVDWEALEGDEGDGDEREEMEDS